MANGENVSRPTVQPGDTLRRLRVRSGLSTRQVAALSRVVARNQGNNGFSISHARLVQVENEGSVPSIQKLFTLGSIYGVSVQEICAAYINLEAAARLNDSMPIYATHIQRRCVQSKDDSPGQYAEPVPASMSPLQVDNTPA